MEYCKKEGIHLWNNRGKLDSVEIKLDADYKNSARQDEVASDGLSRRESGCPARRNYGLLWEHRKTVEMTMSDQLPRRS